MTLSVVALSLWASLALVVPNEEIPTFSVLLVGIALAATAILLPENRRALVAIGAATFLLAGTSFLVQSAENKPAWISKLIQGQQSVQVEVEVLNRPKEIYKNFGGEPNFGVAISLNSVSGKKATGRGYLIYEESNLLRGQELAFEAKFSENSFGSRDAFLLKPMSELSVTREPPGAVGFFGELRKNYSELLAGITPDAKVLVSGLAIGEIGELSDQLSNQMRSVSLTHLVAVSGSNCAIVVGLVYLIAVRLRFALIGRTVASLSALVAYILLVGPDPSVLRAGVMAAAVILMLALGRSGWAINSLAISVISLLIADPWLAVEYGFGLSVLATAGILLLAPALAEKLANKMPKLLALALSVTISAQLFCLPLLLQLQPGLATYSILANLFAGPAVAPVTVLGIIAVVLTPIIPAMVTPISFLASLGTYWIEAVAIFFSQLPITFIPWLGGALAAVMSALVIFLVVIWLRSKSANVRTTGLAGLVIIGVASLSVPAAAEIIPTGWPVESWQFVACDVGQGDALLVQSLDRVALIDVGPDGEAIDSCLRKLRVSHIDLLVLTHFDFDHVGGLEGALRGRSVEEAIISGFPDERPATEESLNLLRSIGVEPLVARAGSGGRMGEFGWRVLSPSKEATEAKDSNDASVVLHFASDEIQILLLGDLGVTGQERITSQVRSLVSASNTPLILKVSHHGSNDQSEEFHSAFNPAVAVFSVGKENGYGHPGSFALNLFSKTNALVLRTDLLGSISIGSQSSKLSWSAKGG